MRNIVKKRRATVAQETGVQRQRAARAWPNAEEGNRLESSAVRELATIVFIENATQHLWTCSNGRPIAPFLQRVTANILHEHDSLPDTTLIDNVVSYSSDRFLIGDARAQDTDVTKRTKAGQ